MQMDLAGRAQLSANRPAAWVASLLLQRSLQSPLLSCMRLGRTSILAQGCKAWWEERLGLSLHQAAADNAQ